MKTIWLILMTMVCFNGFLLAYSVFFESSLSEPTLYSTANITGNEMFEKFKTPGEIGVSLVEGLVTSSPSVLFFLLGTLFTFSTKNPKYFAAGSIAGLISGLWIGSYAIFADLLNTNAIVLGIYSLISVCIGIIVAILILSIFTEQEQLQ